MNPEQQREAIAIACGWKKWQDEEHGLFTGDWSRFIWTAPESHVKHLAHQSPPDYLNDLNAMHVAERALKDQQQDAYIDWLLQCIVVPAEAEFGVTFSDTDTMWVVLHSTAAQRAEAFLRTIGKWKERA